jgi:hypothetical protein
MLVSSSKILDFIYPGFTSYLHPKDNGYVKVKADFIENLEKVYFQVLDRLFVHLDLCMIYTRNPK